MFSDGANVSLDLSPDTTTFTFLFTHTVCKCDNLSHYPLSIPTRVQCSVLYSSINPFLIVKK